MASEQPPRLAWIGLGNMGRGMIKNLVQKATYAGPLHIYNRTQSKTADFVATLEPDKAQVAPSITACVEAADILFLCLADDASVDSTIAEALTSPAAKDTLIVDCSTIHPDTTSKVQQQVEAAGAHFVACPVFGAPPMADAGILVAVLAGPGAQVARVRPFCKGVMARAEIDCADQPAAAASRLKIVGNTFVLHMVEALAEGHVLAEKSGLGVDTLHGLVEVLFPGPYAAYSNRLRSGDYYQREYPAFTAKLARKDWGHAKDLAESAGVELKGLDVAGQHLQDVVDYAGDKGDIAGIYGAVRRESGLEFENQK